MIIRKLFLVILSTTLLTSCATKYLLVSENESFASLTQITDRERSSIGPSGGDDGKSLVYSGQESDYGYNIYFKDNVLSQAVTQKTSGVSFNLNPSYCAENKNVVFQYWDNTNYDIYYVNTVKGRALTQVTYTDENEYNPSWSPDGKLIVFEKGAMPKYYFNLKQDILKSLYISQTLTVTKNQIWIKNTESGELKMIGTGSYPSFSPDGKEIAFIRYDLNKKFKQNGNLWIMSIDGDNPKQLTNSSLGYAIHPSWSPNGDRVIFSLEKKNNKQIDLYIIDSDGDNLQQITNNKSKDFSPIWSKGNFVYFSSNRNSKNIYNIFRITLE
jgi:Tol biopolymer transport system component